MKDNICHGIKNVICELEEITFNRCCNSMGEKKNPNILVTNYNMLDHYTAAHAIPLLKS